MSKDFIPTVYLEPGWIGIYDMAYFDDIRRNATNLWNCV